MHAVKAATDLMFVLYFTGALTTGVGLIAALIGVREVWRYSAIMNLILSSVSNPKSFQKLMTRLNEWLLIL